MSARTKKIVAAILALLVILFGGYVALTDNDPNTNPDYKKAATATMDLIDAINTEEAPASDEGEAK